MQTASLGGQASAGVGIWTAVSSTVAAVASGKVVGATGAAGIMKAFAWAGSAVGGGAVTGIGVVGGAGGALGSFVANKTIFADSPWDGDDQRTRKQGSRAGTQVGAAVATAASVGAVVAGAAPGTAGAAAITSGLAYVGSLVGGGMLAGSATVIAAPMLAALGTGALVHYMVPTGWLWGSKGSVKPEVSASSK